ncbi:hypothetical protein GC194_07725 [bacterium]|nr:hypothetical protein [bacterium]
MKEFHLNDVIELLKGPTREQIITHNQWAATGLDRYHHHSQAKFSFIIEDASETILLKWESNFSKAAMQEDKNIADHGGVALAWFVMSVLFNYKYVEQTHIGNGVDYRFIKNEPDDDDLNFLDEYHYVEVSGLLEESKTNKLRYRVTDKHKQIERGDKNSELSSVIVTLFSEPVTVIERHK